MLIIQKHFLNHISSSYFIIYYKVCSCQDMTTVKGEHCKLRVGLKVMLGKF